MSGFRPFSVLALVVAVLSSGCLATDDRAESPVLQSPVSVVTVPDPDATPGELAPAGGYPDFSTPLTAANTQMSDDEAADLQRQLSALAVARSNGTISEAEYQRRLIALRRLAAEHGAEAEMLIAK